MIVTVPAACAITIPLGPTCTMLVASLVHRTWFVRSTVIPFAYVPVALNRWTSPTCSVALTGVTAILTRGAAITRIVTVVTADVPELFVAV